MLLPQLPQKILLASKGTQNNLLLPRLSLYPRYTLYIGYGQQHKYFKNALQCKKRTKGSGNPALRIYIVVCWFTRLIVQGGKDNVFSKNISVFQMDMDVQKFVPIYHSKFIQKGLKLSLTLIFFSPKLSGIPLFFT